MSSSNTLNVALKRIWPPHSASRPGAKLLQELELTPELFIKRPGGRSVLHGVTEVPPDHRLSRRTASDSQVRQKSIYLVFEFARQGLFQYLDEVIDGSKKDWDLLAHLFEDLAYSIGTIHNEGIVHRDIHSDNVMIREKRFTRSPTVASSDQLVIIDFGESRTLDTLDESMNTYGYHEFWAPEVKNGRTMSMASDIYAVGEVMRRMLRKRCEIAGSPLVPKPLLDTVWTCLRRDTAARLTANQLSKNIGRINWQRFVRSGSGVGDIVFRQEDLVAMPPDHKGSLEDTDSDEDSSDCGD